MQDLSWADFKALVASKTLAIQEQDSTNRYDLTAFDGPQGYTCVLYKTDAYAATVIGCNVSQNATDRSDYVDNYQSAANASIMSRDQFGREAFAINSNKSDWTSYYTTRGDDTAIGNGSELYFNLTEAKTAESPLVVEFTLNACGRVKAGILTWANAGVDGSAIVDFYIVHPTAGNVSHYINKFRCFKDCPGGTLFDTERAGSDISPGLKFRLVVQGPVGFTGSMVGYIFRAATV